MSAEGSYLLLVGVAVVGGLAVSAARPSERARPVEPLFGRDALEKFAFVSVIAAIPFTTFNAIRVAPAVTAGDPLLLAGGLAMTAALVRRGLPRQATPRWLLFAFTALLVSGLLAALRSPGLSNLIPAGEFAVTLGLMPLILMFAAGRERTVALLIEAWLLAAVINSVVGALDLSAGTGVGAELTGIDFANNTGRAPGLTLHPNHLGVVAAMALPMAVARVTRATASGQYTIEARYLSYVIVLAAGVLVSGSRGALIGAVAGIALAPLFQAHSRRGKRMALIALPTLALFAILTFNPGYAARFGVVTGERLTGTVSTTLSDAYRQRAYTTAFQEGIDNPVFGRGFGLVRGAHNIYLQLLQAGGALAVLAFTCFAAGAILMSCRLARATSLSQNLRGLAGAAGASLAVWLIIGLGQNPLYDRYLYLPVGILLAIGRVQTQEHLPSD